MLGGPWPFADDFVAGEYAVGMYEGVLVGLKVK